MMSEDSCFALDLGIVSSLGAFKARHVLGGGICEAPPLSSETIFGKAFKIARAGCYGTEGDLRIAEYKNRVNALLATAARELEPSVAKAKERFGASRIAVILGSTDNGSEESFNAIQVKLSTETFPEGYSLHRQSAYLAPQFLADELGLTGPVMAVSTACASSASAIARARDFLKAGLCDAVVAGGVDIVSDTVALGFSSLEAVSPDRCLPFSRNRRGITLGEGAAIFLLARENFLDGPGAGIQLIGAGEASDAHHLTAPDPMAGGAQAAMEAALADAGLAASAIDYLNLHGTGTELNDAMESLAVAKVFGEAGVPASSTKAFVGHTLGAAGAIELGFCWLSMSELNESLALPPHLWDGAADEKLPVLDLIEKGRRSSAPIKTSMSVSFAFGGVDTALILGRN